MASEKEREAFTGRGGVTSSPKVHRLCQKRLEHATNKSEGGSSGGAGRHDALYHVQLLSYFVHRQLCSLHAGCHEEGRMVGILVV